jgi:hypothetical protein
MPVRAVRRSLLGALTVAVVGLGVTTWQRSSRETMVLATTTCPFQGAPVITISPDVVPVDSAPVSAHEEVHAAQCRELGPWRYRWENLFDNGKLALEAPAYCAGASVRMRAGQDSGRVRQRLIESTVEALSHVADSVTVVAALRGRCSELLGP